MSPREKVVTRCLQPYHAKYFFFAISTLGIEQCGSPIEYCFILRYWLMILVNPHGELCRVCKKFVLMLLLIMKCDVYVILILYTNISICRIFM